MLQWAADDVILDNAINSGLFFAALTMLRILLVRALKHSHRKWPSEIRRRWIRNVRSLHWACLLIGMTYIWSEQVHAFAVSIFAIALAIVLAVKELLMCAHGSWVRIRSGSYAVGDRIEIKGIRGDVVYVTLLSTTLLEVGPGEISHQQTGRSICIPNSMLLKYPVTNESFLGNFLLHNVLIPMKRSEDWQGAKNLLLQLANEECAPFLDQARKKVREVEHRETVDFPSVEPRVTVQMPDPERVDLVLRIPTPAHLKGRIERNITDRFLDVLAEQESYIPSPSELEALPSPQAE